MDREKDQKLIIYSYQKLWKWKMKIYALSKDLPLPQALPIKMGLYVLIGVGIAILVSKIPGLKNIPFVLRCVALPIGIAKLLDSVKLDGKNPILFFWGLLLFWLFEQGTMIEHFKRYEVKQKPIKLHWNSGSVGNKNIYINSRPIRMHWRGGTRGGTAFV